MAPAVAVSASASQQRCSSGLGLELIGFIGFRVDRVLGLGLIGFGFFLGFLGL